MCKHSDPRRQFLVQILAAGTASMLPGLLSAQNQISQLEGLVRVNGRLIDKNARIRAGDVVETGEDSSIIFVIDSDAILLRAKSRIALARSKLLINFRVLTGKMLAVFSPGRRTVVTNTVTAGIRGTGIYVEADRNKTYLCTCYGEVDLQAAADASVQEVVESHKGTNFHNARYIHRNAGKTRDIKEIAPLVGHENAEMIMLESLVNRNCPLSS